MIRVLGGVKFGCPSRVVQVRGSIAASLAVIQSLIMEGGTTCMTACCTRWRLPCRQKISQRTRVTSIALIAKGLGAYSQKDTLDSTDVGNAVAKEESIPFAIPFSVALAENRKMCTGMLGALRLVQWLK